MKIKKITAETAFEPENRRRYLGGTDMSAILGYNPYKTAYECWIEKTGRPVEPQQESDILIFGHLLEPVIANEWLRRNKDWQIVSENEFTEDPEFDFLAANTDRIIKNINTGELAVLECKTVASSAFKHWKLGVPLTYYTQGQHYLGVKGFDRVIFAMLVMDSRELTTFEVGRDETFINEIRDFAVKFWDENVTKDIAPDKTAYDWAQFRSKEETVIASPEDIKLFEEIKALDKQMKELKAQIDAKKEAIQLKMEDKTAMETPDGAVLFTWRGSDSDRVDSKLLKTNYPDVWDKVKKSSYTRRFLTKGTKED